MTNDREYWAEGTAALFDTRHLCSTFPVPRTDYTPGFLAGNDPLLDAALRRVFDP